MKLNRINFLILFQIIFHTTGFSEIEFSRRELKQNLSCIRLLNIIVQNQYNKRLSANEQEFYYLRNKEVQYSRRFIHSPFLPNLHEPFLTAFDETLAVEHYFINQPELSPHKLISTSAALLGQNTINKIEQNVALRITVARAGPEGAGLPNRKTLILKAQPTSGEFSQAVVGNELANSFANTKVLFSDLYQLYSTPNSGREHLVTKLKQQDIDFSHRTTHFAIELNGEVLAHIQAQISESPQEKLTVEENLKMNIERKPGKKYVEIGRLLVKDVKLLKPETIKQLELFGGRDAIRTLLYEKTFSWLANEVGPDKVVMEMSDSVRKLFLNQEKKGFAQWKFDHEGKAFTQPNGNNEWLMEISGKNLTETADRETLSYINQQLELVRKIRADPQTPEKAKPNTLSLFIRKNQIPSINRLIKSGKIPEYFAKKLNLPKSRKVFDHSFSLTGEASEYEMGNEVLTSEPLGIKKMNRDITSAYYYFKVE